MIAMLMLISAKLQEVSSQLEELANRVSTLELQVASSAKVVEGLAALFRLPDAVAVHFVVDTGSEILEYKGNETMILKAGQSVVVALKPVDRFGNPAGYDETVPPKWASSAPDVCTITPAAGGLGATVQSVGKMGTAQISCVIDAKPGAEAKEIVGVLDIEVKAGEAVMVTLEAGIPQDPPTP